MIYKTRASLDLRKFSFPYRVVNNWNELPEWMVSADSAEKFESRLDKFWKNLDQKHCYRARSSTTHIQQTININVHRLPDWSHRSPRASTRKSTVSNSSPQRGLAKNYRLVTLTSHIIKIIERVVKRKLTEHLSFRKGRSCLSQLLVHQEALIEDISKSKNVDVIYLDFATAFDKVDHGLVLHKLEDLVIERNLGKWMHSFLTDRKQKLSVQRHLLYPSDMTSGVPQGSVLGSFCF